MKYFIFILILTSQNSYCSLWAWPQNQMPHTFIMSNNTAPSQLANDNNTRNLITNQIYLWNSNPDLGTVVSINYADLQSLPSFGDNGGDEIRFDLWDYNDPQFEIGAAGYTKMHHEGEPLKFGLQKDMLPLYLKQVFI